MFVQDCGERCWLSWFGCNHLCDARVRRPVVSHGDTTPALRFCPCGTAKIRLDSFGYFHEIGVYVLLTWLKKVLSCRTCNAVRFVSPPARGVDASSNTSQRERSVDAWIHIATIILPMIRCGNLPPLCYMLVSDHASHTKLLSMAFRRRAKTGAKSKFRAESKFYFFFFVRKGVFDQHAVDIKKT